MTKRRESEEFEVEEALRRESEGTGNYNITPPKLPYVETLNEEWVEFLEAELYYCQQVQSWSSGSTRSSWVPELEAILHAEEKEEFLKAVEAADAKRRDLAYTIAEKYAEDVEALKLTLAFDSSEEEFSEIKDATTMAELVTWVRNTNRRLYMDTRDGWHIDKDDAYAFASVRPLYDYGDHLTKVAKDLLTGVYF